MSKSKDMKNLLFILGITISSALVAQKNVFLNIAPKVGGTDLSLGSTVMTDLNGIAFNLDHFDYYISNVEIVHDGEQLLTLPSEVFLIEPQNHTIYLGYLDINTIEEIRFGIGVPANMNTISGADAIDISVYPEGHPLSFQEPSMHWGWSSGYMFMIVGGLSDSNNDGVPNKLFEIHSLGDGNYAEVSLPVVATASLPNQLDIHLNCNLDVWLTGANLNTVDVLHGASGTNQTVMKNPEILDVFTQPSTADLSAIQAPVGKTWFFNSSEGMNVSWEGMRDLASIQLVDARGRILATNGVEGMSGSTDFSQTDQGTYQVLFLDTEGNLLRTLNAAR